MLKRLLFNRKPAPKFEIQTHKPVGEFTEENLTKPIQIDPIQVQAFSKTNPKIIYDRLSIIAEKKTLEEVLEESKKAIRFFQEINTFDGFILKFSEINFRKRVPKVQVSALMKEKRTGIVPFYEISNPLLNLGIKKHNTFHNGEFFKLSVGADLSQENKLLSFTRPLFQKNSYNLRGLNISMIQEQFKQFDKFQTKTTGCHIAYSSRILNDYYNSKPNNIRIPKGLHLLSLNLQLRYFQIPDDEKYLIYRQNASEQYKSSIKYSYEIDKRNNTHFPTSGYLLSTKSELAGLGFGAKFIKSEMKAHTHFSIGKGFSFGLIGALGLTTSLSKGSLLGSLDRFKQQKNISLSEHWQTIKGLMSNATNDGESAGTEDKVIFDGSHRLGGDSYGRFTAMFRHLYPISKKKNLKIGTTLFFNTNTFGFADFLNGSTFKKLKNLASYSKSSCGLSLGLLKKNSVYSLTVAYDLKDNSKKPSFFLNYDFN
ncbi:sorting and assembly machinery component 50 [Anaeramoeba flamelloides]|uniref:Sorting and assembly machinery component 50 n=1 Tax=Anaeramoeba flamelloides TaxID=1746091 RepID=A0AAV7YSP2_9EUKA|nr:sorting and assembly machinery component 50 [Anaeramoeba flamelloides]